VSGGGALFTKGVDLGSSEYEAARLVILMIDMITSFLGELLFRLLLLMVQGF